MINNFSKYVLERGGWVSELKLPVEHSEGLGVANPSIFIKGDKVLCNIRRVNYIFHINDSMVWQSWYGPSCYHHPDDDVTLTTENYFCELDDDMQVKPETVKHVDYSKFYTKPKWEFIGEEDCRIVEWNKHLYLTGCRRDTEETGISRMELSEIDNDAKEIKRIRIPSTGDDKSYCEKNWMPVLDQPYTYVKWCNPIEVVKYDPKKNKTETIVLKQYEMKSDDPLCDLRGNSQVIRVGDYYIAHLHEVNLWKNRYEEKDAVYYQRFIVWDKDWNLVKLSPRFWFMNFKIEFGVGMIYKNDCFYVSFAVFDNASFVIKIPKDVFWGFVGLQDEVKPILGLNNTLKLLAQNANYIGYIMNVQDPYASYNVGLGYYNEKQYACAHAFFIKSADLCAVDKFRYRQLGYDAFYMCMKCNEMLGRRLSKLINMYGQLFDWDDERFQTYYELSKLYYGIGENKNNHYIAFGYAALAKAHLNRIIPITGFGANERQVRESVLFQYYVCAYRCYKDYVAVPGLRYLRDNGLEETKNKVLALGLNLN